MSDSNHLPILGANGDVRILFSSPRVSAFMRMKPNESEDICKSIIEYLCKKKDHN